TRDASTFGPGCSLHPDAPGFSPGCRSFAAMKIVSVVGARPQFVKAAVLSRSLRQRFDEVLVHTGQHYDDLMSDVFFRELGLAAPDVNLGVGSASHAVQTARILEGLEPVFERQQPDLVLVYGDTNSTLAGALTASKMGLPVAHVEAGFRSHERDLPEETNRIVADHVSSYLFCATGGAVECLRREGIERGVYEVGDLMYDSMLTALPQAEAIEPQVLKKHGVEHGAYYLATVHRAASTHDATTLASLFEAFGRLDAPVVLPLHPRTRTAMSKTGIVPAANLRLGEPVGYIEMLALERNARAILTDSGGVRREAYFLSIPCVTLRTQSEWPETLTGGWDVLGGCDADLIVKAAQRPRPKAPPEPVFGDGHAAQRIVEILEHDPPHS
ncbi:MAG TPA: UDP-N-acetylglucosamine 2-epimerase (non-hydrolyzing), partial [Dehalococcoidia bacterium]|nr:UDP-N-acetylglucosamine 2-epimerase (non-hydrolyzing) [Dehalococcoidia bacterium]